ncbi:MAG: hypothetical protein M1812_002860 [Candelaria pacifica]|nr:MAG: hypothetical protein M1812_002860 [Candelaria pacifica]
MAPPSQLSVATSSVQRLVKEEASYRTELQQQETRIQKLQTSNGSNDDDGNAEYQLRQERQAVEETKAVLPPLRERIKEAIAKLESQLEAEKHSGKETPVEEITKAKEAIASAKTAYREIV